MVWLNRVGMLLEFLSFFFAAPEIVTEIRDDGGEWLRSLEQVLERGLRKSPPWIAAVLFLSRTGVAVVLIVIPLLPRLRQLTPLQWILVAFAVLISVGAVFLDLIMAIFLAQRINENVLARLLQILADDKRIRLRWLKIGVGMFLLGFLLQFIATF